jgi:hypothetical protein
MDLEDFELPAWTKAHAQVLERRGLDTLAALATRPSAARWSSSRRGTRRRIETQYRPGLAALTTRPPGHTAMRMLDASRRSL